MHRLFLITFLLFIANTSIAAVFVVTSNADSGPGTLRDALTKAAANSSAEKDYINFNLPGLSEAGRTITIKTKLPDISSNLVIDGTTQPGAALGVSDAKIILQPDLVSNKFNAFTLSYIDGFELYGFYVRDFTNFFKYYYLGNEEESITAALYVEASKNIQLGAPGKGNIFTNDAYVMLTAWISSKTGQPSPPGVENLKVQSNLIGFEPDGKSYRAKTISTSGLDITGCKGNIEFGGDDVSERNFFGYGEAYIVQRGAGAETAFASNIKIKNNYFNYDVNGQPIKNLYPEGSTYMLFFLNNLDNEYNSYPYNYDFINNKIQFPLEVRLYGATGNITFQGNEELMGTEPADGNGGEKRINLNTQGKILIGGDEPGQGNMIYGCQLVLSGLQSTILEHTGIYCVHLDTYDWVWIPGNIIDKLPKISISKVTTSSATGTATPLSKIELYWDDDCHVCQPQTYFATVYANASGNWTYNGIIKSGVIASATLNGFTSTYTIRAAINDLTLKHSTCGENNGSAKFIYANAGGYEVKNDQGNVIGNSAEINNLVPGTYTMKATNGSFCASEKYTFTVLDATPKINSDNKQIINPSCGNNGSLTGLYLDNTDVLDDAASRGDYNTYTYKWIDAAGNVKGNDLDLTNAAAGTYHLEVSYKGQCPTVYGPIILTNTSGPNIDESAKLIQSTPCGQSTGSIKNITVTGTDLKYSWKNEQGAEVAATKDLIDQPAGKYTLQVTDDSQCGPIYSSTIQILEVNGITIDDAQKIIIQATCQYDDGSISNIQVNGATKYKWYDDNNNLVSSQLNLTNAATGNYHLIAANDNGCSQQTAVYAITRQAPINYALTKTLKKATCGENNGSIQLIFQNAPAILPSSYKWVNHITSQTTNTTMPILTGIDAGQYDIYATTNGCEQYLISYTIDRIPGLTVATNNVQVINDHCTAGTGSIKGVQATGVTPIQFSWTDNNGTSKGTSANLLNAAAGTYHLKITDGSNCEQGFDYTIYDQSDAVLPPSVSDVKLCSPENALLTVNNIDSRYSYRLYEDNNSATPIDEQQTGRFKISALANRSYYISQLTGSCESSRAEVKVFITGLSGTDIANVFTPNGDGVNDYWKITGIENNPNALVQVFNRNGQKVFESKGYATPFDGKINGKALPTGTYYYIINMGGKCSLLSGNLTIIR